MKVKNKIFIIEDKIDSPQFQPIRKKETKRKKNHRIKFSFLVKYYIVNLLVFFKFVTARSSRLLPLWADRPHQHNESYSPVKKGEFERFFVNIVTLYRIGF